MKPFIILIFIVLLSFAFLKYGRSLYKPMVHKAKGKETTPSIIAKIEPQVWERLQKNLNLAGFKEDYPKELILLGLKTEQVLEVYAKREAKIVFIKSYPFTAFSGKLGPKLKEGDKQIPEGIYKVEYLNPNSAFYLSIKVSYPNAFDIAKSRLAHQQDMGGDIFIHGKAATIGCIPVGDDAIEELFLLTQKAYQNEVKILISPKDFRIDESYPRIEGIDWEEELYDELKAALSALPSPNRK